MQLKMGCSYFSEGVGKTVSEKDLAVNSLSQTRQVIAEGKRMHLCRMESIISHTSIFLVTERALPISNIILNNMKNVCMSLEVQ